MGAALLVAGLIFKNSNHYIIEGKDMTNQVATIENNKALGPMTVKSLFAKDEVKSKFQEMMRKRAAAFITSVMQITSQNEMLSNADPVSIYQSAAVAATLDLPLNNNLGF